MARYSITVPYNERSYGEVLYEVDADSKEDAIEKLNTSSGYLYWCDSWETGSDWYDEDTTEILSINLIKENE